MNNKFLFIIVCAVTIACSDHNKKPKIEEIINYKQKLVGINKELVKHFTDSISKINKIQRLELQQSPTGLWYKVYHVGKGDSAKNNKIATVSYKVYLFKGKLCYSTDTSGPRNLIVGRSGLESGMEEALKLLRVGDSAIFILPPHLAYGLLGDQKKIPRLAIIEYHFTLQGLQDMEFE